MRMENDRALDCAGVARLLGEWDQILLLCHASPDGDTLGSATALCRGLRALGKTVNIDCADPIPEKFQYLFEGLPQEEREPRYIVTVDVADVKLLGAAWKKWGERADLAIDHHGTREVFTPLRWVEPDSAATAEMIFLLLEELGAPVDPATAGCVYTGIATDTGCFRYRNVTPRTHRIAARTLELGAAAGEINRRMFESKSRAQVEAERRVMEGMEFLCGGKAAMIQVPWKILEETGTTESDLEGLASLPRQIQGVVVGITLKERENGTVKASVRADPPANAAALCAKFGGGGHQGAAGCSFDKETIEQAAQAMGKACQEYLESLGLL